MKKALPTSYLKNSVMNFKDFIIVNVEHNEINIWGFFLFVTPCFPVNQQTHIILGKFFVLFEP